MSPAEIALAIQLAEQGIAYWEGIKVSAAAGTLTQADLDASTNKFGVDLTQFAADVAALPS